MIIKIFNINMWLLPLWVSKDNDRRISYLIDYIKVAHPDIITLQEVWVTKYCRRITESLPMYHASYEKKSGLLTLSRLEAVSAKFHPFRKRRPNIIERSVTKGVLLTEYVFGKEKVRILNTHLYTPYSHSEKGVAKSQVSVLKQLCVGVTFVCGDLNLHVSDFQEVNQGFFLFAENTQNTFPSTNPYKKWWDFKVVMDTKIDYILARVPKRSRLSYRSDIVESPVMSDHSGIITEVSIGTGLDSAKASRKR